MTDDIARLEDELLGGPRTLSLRDLAERAGVDVDEARTFWRAMGFPATPADEPVFTADDAAALERFVELIGSDRIGRTTAISLTRAFGHSSERLVLWQVEALVEDAAIRLDLDDTSARLLILDRLHEFAPILEAQLVHSWRRQLAAMAGRITAEFGDAHATERADQDALPLERAVGFADMVAYTTRTAELGSHELATFVHRFETTARDVISSLGGRVVKTIGDAVLFVADDVETGVLIGIGLAREMGTDDASPPVRVAVTWGRLLSRFGDVFGPIVNTAARLTGIAEPGTVLVDPPTAALLEGNPRFVLRPLPERELAGLGTMAPVQISEA